MRIRLAAVVAAVCCAIGVATPAIADSDTESHIRALMAGQFDRPEQRLEVGPIVVVSNHAIAGWTQGDMGGRALLRKKGHEWHIVLCSGDQIKSAEALHKVGLPHDVATQMATRLAGAEEKIAPARLAMFARFDGILMLDGSGNHPPGHHPPHSPAHKPHGH